MSTSRSSVTGIRTSTAISTDPTDFMALDLEPIKVLVPTQGLSCDTAFYKKQSR
jgi:hypothetical protein